MTDGKIRFFVLPPSQNLQEWLSALRSSAEGQGLSVVEVLTGNEQIAPEDIVITSDLDFARLAGANEANSTVLRLQPFVGLEDCELADIPFRVLDVTRRIAAAYDFKGRSIPSGGNFPSPFAGLSAPATSLRTPSVLEEGFQNALAFLEQGSAEWSPAIFSYSKSGGGSENVGVVDITGRPRLVVYGPYIFLTRGVWRITVRLAFDVDAAQKPYQIQWGSSESYAEYDFVPNRSGIFEISMEHDWPSHAASEVRVMLLEGAFHGSLTLLGVNIERVF